MTSPLVTVTLRHEAGALMARLAHAKPFGLHMPMVAAAEPPAAARWAIDAHMARLLRDIRNAVTGFVAWLLSPAGRAVPDATAQARFALLRLRSLIAFTQFDLFSDALTQRSEHEFGVWLAGLDGLAADGLRLHGGYYTPPPALCYLDRGAGAAIRRARTRLPGGGENPVALIRVPRERMIGAGIGSSLIHEVGHQAAALLDLVASFHPVVGALEAKAGPESLAWRLWQRWLSEIVADFWSVAHLGIGSTIGLMSVVSLPRAFVFRLKLDDPHPTPWVRVLLSAAMGESLYPDPQWIRLRRLWQALYRRQGLDVESERAFRLVEATLPTFVGLLVNHRPASLGGASLAEALPTRDRQPPRLRALFSRASRDPAAWLAMRPTLAFAAIGQARADRKLGPWPEASLINRLLIQWASRRPIHATTDRRCTACAAAAHAN